MHHNITNSSTSLAQCITFHVPSWASCNSQTTILVASHTSTLASLLSLTHLVPCACLMPPSDAIHLLSQVSLVHMLRVFTKITTTLLHLCLLAIVCFPHVVFILYLLSFASACYLAKLQTFLFKLLIQAYQKT